MKMENGLVTILIIAIVGIVALGIVAGFSDTSIITDQAFKVVSGTSNYSCVISEIDNDLLLNCLETK